MLKKYSSEESLKYLGDVLKDLRFQKEPMGLKLRATDSMSENLEVDTLLPPDLSFKELLFTHLVHSWDIL